MQQKSARHMFQKLQKLAESKDGWKKIFHTPEELILKQ